MRARWWPGKTSPIPEIVPGSDGSGTVAARDRPNIPPVQDQAIRYMPTVLANPRAGYLWGGGEYVAVAEGETLPQSDHRKAARSTGKVHSREAGAISAALTGITGLQGYRRAKPCPLRGTKRLSLRGASGERGNGAGQGIRDNFDRANEFLATASGEERFIAW